MLADFPKSVSIGEHTVRKKTNQSADVELAAVLGIKGHYLKQHAIDSVSRYNKHSFAVVEC